jgi:hypothetical protein
MSRKAVVIIAGVITSIVMVLALGLTGSANWFNRPASATSAEASAASAEASVTTATTATTAQCANPEDLTALQTQLNDYQVALQQANTQLQAAYDEIARLQTQGRFMGEHEDNENEGEFFHLFDD